VEAGPLPFFFFFGPAFSLPPIHLSSSLPLFVCCFPANLHPGAAKQVLLRPRWRRFSRPPPSEERPSRLEFAVNTHKGTPPPFRAGVVSVLSPNFCRVLTGIAHSPPPPPQTFYSPHFAQPCPFVRNVTVQPRPLGARGPFLATSLPCPFDTDPHPLRRTPPRFFPLLGNRSSWLLPPGLLGISLVSLPSGYSIFRSATPRLPFPAGNPISALTCNPPLVFSPEMVSAMQVPPPHDTCRPSLPKPSSVCQSIADQFFFPKDPFFPPPFCVNFFGSG